MSVSMVVRFLLLLTFSPFHDFFFRIEGSSSSSQEAMSIEKVQSKAHFRTQVSQPNLTVVMFTAMWCQPCKKILPEVERLSYRYPKVTFIKCDIDDHAEIAERCFIKALPTFMFCRSGDQLGYTVGADMRDVRAQVMRFVTPEEKG